jgi:hypothetical protein
VGATTASTAGAAFFLDRLTGAGGANAAAASSASEARASISAATVSSVGAPAILAKPGMASSTPRRCGSRAWTTKVTCSPLEKISLALLGGGSPIADNGT